MLSRRSALMGLGTILASARASLAVAAAPTEQRLVVVILRGGMDGLAVVPPYGDAGLRALRGDNVLPPPGQPEGLLDLGGVFGMHPALAQCHAMYAAGELMVVQAVAGPYRERSHFKAQDCLESGSDHRLDTGWLNRALAALPKATRGQEQALAVGVTVPLLLRGPVRVSNWSPGQFAEPQADLIMTIASLNAADPVTGPAFQSALDSRGLSAMAQEHSRNTFPAMAKVAGEMLGAASGPRVAVLELGGWDTHAGQTGRIVSPLRQLDQGLAALKAALGPAWVRTAVLVMTEFGRTARINGTRGTDHGTASVAFVLGGAVAGGRVVGDWPGLGAGKLFEDRDLAPTTDLRAVAKGLLGGHLGLDEKALAGVFPDSTAVQGMRVVRG